MELSSLYYFKAVAEAENISKAAQLLNVSQPALSKSIMKLEASLGINLFTRQKGRIQLSEIGAEYYRYVSKAFEQLAAGEKCVETYIDKMNREICIASPISDLLNTLVRDFLERSSDDLLRVSQFIYQPEMLEKKLLSNEVDFVISPIPVKDSQLETIELLNEEVFLAVGKKHRLACHQSVALSSLSGERFLVNESVFDKKIVGHHCELAGFAPNIALCSSESRVVADSLESNLGICFIPASMLTLQRKSMWETIVPLRITDVAVRRVVFLVKCRDRLLSPNARRLFIHTKGYFKKLNEIIADYTEKTFRDVPPPDGFEVNIPL